MMMKPDEIAEDVKWLREWDRWARGERLDGDVKVGEFGERGAARQRIDRIEAALALVPRWIPCSEPPPKIGDYLVSTPYADYPIVVAWFTEDGQWEMEDGEVEQVLAWMPLPKGFK